jgi:hypothetical protein
MNRELDKKRLSEAFAALGGQLREPTQLLIGGAGALILRGELQRATTDCDVLRSRPDIGRLQSAIHAVAVRCGLVGGWLNGSAQTYAEIVPPDFESRVHSMPAFDRLQVLILDRQDVMVMKLFAGRPRDLADIAALAPTTSELQFARRELLRLKAIDEERSERMSAMLDELSHAKR